MCLRLPGNRESVLQNEGNAESNACHDEPFWCFKMRIFQQLTPSFRKFAVLMTLGMVLAGSPPMAIAATSPLPDLPTFPLPTQVDDQTRVRIDGDRSMTAINQQLKAQYQEQFPGTQVEIDAQGTDVALQKLLKDEIDLAAIGRPLTAAEKAKGLIEIPLSQERIAVIVGRNNPFKENLTVDQFVKIVRGDITDWAEVGGEPGAIRFIDRPTSSDTRLALSRYGLFPEGGFTTGANTVQLDKDDTAAVIQALGRDGIGYGIASQLVNQSNARIVKLVVMHEALPDDPLYPYAQPRGYAYKKSPDGAARSFLGLATTGAGLAAIDAAKANEAQAVVDALKPAPLISLTQTPEPEDSAYSQTLKALPLWLKLILPLGLLGLLLQAILKWLERQSDRSAPTGRSSIAFDGSGDRPMPPSPTRGTTDTLAAELIEMPSTAETPSVQAAPVVAVAPATDVALATETPSGKEEAPVMEEATIVSETPAVTSDAQASDEQPDEAVIAPRVAETPLETPAIAADAGIGEAAIVTGAAVSSEMMAANRPIQRRANFWEDFQQVYERGIECVGRGDAAAALGYFNRAIELNPDFVDGWTAKGNALTQLGQVDEARITLERARQLRPEDEAIARLLTDLSATAEQGVSVSDLSVITPEPVVVESPEPAPVLEAEAEVPPPLGEMSAIASVIPVGDGRTGYTPDAFTQAFQDNLLRFQGKSLEQATVQDYYRVLAYMVRDRLLQFATPETYLARPQVRWVGELSAEYMPGPHLMNNLINLGIVDPVRQGLQTLGQNLEMVAEQEEEPGLGRGGLGRLMVCYLDSLSTQEVPAIGYGLRYEYGIFDQRIEDGWQVEVPDTWLQAGNPWEIERPEGMQEVTFGGRTEAYMDDLGQYRVRWIPQEVIKGFPYDTPILGYRASTVNLMRLWRAETSDNLCKTLYPVDRDEPGRILRLKQQFFLISCSLQDAIRLHLQAGHPITHLHERFHLQLNDTDSALAIAELMRLLVDVHGVAWDQAWAITRNTLSYTNHSLMPETLDDLWSLSLLGSVLPRPLEIVMEINARFLDAVRHQNADVEWVRRLSLIQEGGLRYLRLTNLACVGSQAINGVSALHSELLKQKILPDFYALYPEKFSNKTNGISPRRFLLLANPGLADLITRRIGDGWITNLEALQPLAAAAEDWNFRQEWRTVKQTAKQGLSTYIQQQTGWVVDTHSLFDGQAMVMHEYKRQHLNLLHILTLYNRIKANPSVDVVPRTFIFSGKAAPDYFTAKLIIKLIHAVADVVNHDADVRGRLSVVFLPDYAVKLVQRIYPALDLSEHLSTSGTEASDTGNMMAALNGALIIGTPDGSNLEVRDAVGGENFFQFGHNAQEVETLRSHPYNPYEIYTGNAELKGAIDLLTSGLLSNGDPELFRPLVNLLLSSDYYLLLADYASYITCQERVSEAYRNPDNWTRMAIISTSRMGHFSSDRAVREYREQIWQAQPVTELQQYAQT